MTPFLSPRKVATVFLTFGLAGNCLSTGRAAPPTPAQPNAPTQTDTQAQAAPITRTVLGRTFTFAPLPQPNGYDALQEAITILRRLDNKTAEALARNDIAAQREYVTTNVLALTRMRQGLQMPVQVPLPTRDFDVEMTFNARTREMARLLQAESALAAQDGDLEGATDSALDAVVLGIEIGRGGPIVTAMSSTAIEGIGRDQLWTLLPNLNAEQTRSIQSQLIRWDAIRPDPQGALYVEEYEAFVSLEDILQQAKWDDADEAERRTILKELDEDEDDLKATVHLSQKDITEHVGAAWNAQLAALRQPYAPALVEEPEPRDLFINTFASVGTNFRASYERNHASTLLLIVGLGLRAYEHDKGQLPATLGELTPAYLPHPLADPFAPGQPFRYKRMGQTFSLYSVGPDSKDDGGQVYNREKRTGDLVAPLRTFAL